MANSPPTDAGDRRSAIGEGDLRIASRHAKISKVKPVDSLACRSGPGLCERAIVPAGAGMLLGYMAITTVVAAGVSVARVAVLDGKKLLRAISE